MCFSATASFTAGLVVGGLGAATLPLVANPRERAFAALPLIFGVHQVLEGVVWMQVEDAGAVAIRTPAVAVWLFVAWLVLPVFVPLAGAGFEPDAQRQRARPPPKRRRRARQAFRLFRPMRMCFPTAHR